MATFWHNLWVATFQINAEVQSIISVHFKIALNLAGGLFAIQLFV